MEKTLNPAYVKQQLLTGKWSRVICESAAKLLPPFNIGETIWYIDTAWYMTQSASKDPKNYVRSMTIEGISKSKYGWSISGKDIAFLDLNNTKVYYSFKSAYKALESQNMPINSTPFDSNTKQAICNICKTKFIYNKQDCITIEDIPNNETRTYITCPNCNSAVLILTTTWT